MTIRSGRVCTRFNSVWINLASCTGLFSLLEGIKTSRNSVWISIGPGLKGRDECMVIILIQS
jgi:hypothetical protein